MLRVLSLSVFAILINATAAAAYELVTLDGTVRETDSVQFAGEICIVADGAGSERLEAAQVDYYQTFRRNAESGAGNVIVFKTGAFFTFETVEISRGRVVLGLGEQGKVTVPEQVVDFEQSVKEGATIRLPRVAARVDVAKKAPGSPAGSARGGGGAESQTATAGSRSEARSRMARNLGRTVPGQRGGPNSSASRRSASLRGVEESGSVEGDPEEPPGSSDPFNEGQVDEGETERESPPSRTDRDGMADPEEVRRQADERGDATGMTSVIISSNDSVDVAGVQFRLRYPVSCSPAGAQPIGAFANASMSQPNGSVGGRPLFAMALVWAADSTTSLPGQIARVDFIWTGTEPNPSEFLIVSASASDETGNAVRGFRAVAQVLN